MTPIARTVMAHPHRHDARPAGRVLIADDYPDCAESLAMLLGISGFDTATVTDGVGLLPAAARFAPDVVILDPAIYGCNGEDVARRLLSLPPGRRPRVIVTTGFADENRRSRLARLGVDAYLVKPADPDELLSYVCQACRGRTPR